MNPEWYKLCAAESYIILSANDVAALQLTTAQLITERLLRLRLQHLANRSTAQAIDAMLDQQAPTGQITLVPYLQQS